MPADSAAQVIGGRSVIVAGRKRIAPSGGSRSAKLAPAPPNTTAGPRA